MRDVSLLLAGDLLEVHTRREKRTLLFANLTCYQRAIRSQRLTIPGSNMVRQRLFRIKDMVHQHHRYSLMTKEDLHTIKATPNRLPRRMRPRQDIHKWMQTTMLPEQIDL